MFITIVFISPLISFFPAIMTSFPMELSGSYISQNANAGFNIFHLIFAVSALEILVYRQFNLAICLPFNLDHIVFNFYYITRLVEDSSPSPTYYHRGELLCHD